MCFGPSTLGAGAKTRLESRIKKFTPHCVCRPWGSLVFTRADSKPITWTLRCTAVVSFNEVLLACACRHADALSLSNGLSTLSNGLSTDTAMLPRYHATTPLHYHTTATMLPNGRAVALPRPRYHASRYHTTTLSLHRNHVTKRP